jgi:hypothetical protein
MKLPTRPSSTTHVLVTSSNSRVVTKCYERSVVKEHSGCQLYLHVVVSSGRMKVSRWKWAGLGNIRGTDESTEAVITFGGRSFCFTAFISVAKCIGNAICSIETTTQWHQLRDYDASNVPWTLKAVDCIGNAICSIETTTQCHQLRDYDASNVPWTHQWIVRRSILTLRAGVSFNHVVKNPWEKWDSISILGTPRASNNLV